MKMRNTTDWPDYFLRRMLAWVCKQVQLPVRTLRQVEFGKRKRGCFNGRAWLRRIRVVIGPASCYPVEPFHYPGRTNDQFLSPRMADQVEALVAVTAHEAQHVYGYHYGGGRGERHTRGEERRVHALFVANKEALLAAWQAAPAERPAKKPQSAQEKRAAKVMADLERWQRKAKLAATKIRKLKRQAAYYDRALAASRPVGGASR